MQKLYGKDPESLGSVTQVFRAVLANYPAKSVIRAFELWMERSQEFPTPSDIAGIIKRKGKPPLSREVYISLSKKDPEHRTSEDWRFLREYEAEQQQEYADDFADPAKEQASLQENIRLRGEVNNLKAEIHRLGELLREERERKRPDPTPDDKVQRTVSFMRQSGADESDIAAFMLQAGVPADKHGPHFREGV